MILLVFAHSWVSNYWTANIDEAPLFTYEITPFTSTNTLLLTRDLAWFIWNGRVAVRHTNRPQHYLHAIETILIPRLSRENMLFVATKNIQTLTQEDNPTQRNNLFVWAYQTNYLTVHSLCRQFGYTVT